MIELKKLTRAIAAFGKAQAKNDEQLETLITACIYHAVKDGQTTPATSLYANCGRFNKKAVSLYLTQHGPFTFSEKEGIKYAPSKAKEYAGKPGDAERIAFTENHIDNLPSLLDNMGKDGHGKNYRDMDVMQALIHMVKRAGEVSKAGKSVKVDPKIAKLWAEISGLAAAAK